jgi:hypothetical protein
MSVDSIGFVHRSRRFLVFLVKVVKHVTTIVLTAIGSALLAVASWMRPLLTPHMQAVFDSWTVMSPTAYRLCALGVAITGTVLASFFAWEEEHLEAERQRQGWMLEEQRFTALRERLAPRLRIEFDPSSSKFVSLTSAGPTPMLYIRVIARALSPVAHNCRAYLARISRWDGAQYIAVFEEQLPMPWSNENPLLIAPKELNHDVDALLDVAWFAPPDNQASFPAFGFLNHAAIVPNSIAPVLDRHFQHPEENLKLDILITATDSMSATLSLNIHRGVARPWNNPQIGWMDCMAIRRGANFWPRNRSKAVLMREQPFNLSASSLRVDPSTRLALAHRLRMTRKTPHCHPEHAEHRRGDGRPARSDSP